MPTYKAVIFDMDGLLLDTERLANKALQATSVEVLGIELPEELVINMIGLNEDDSLNKMESFLNIKLPKQDFSNTFYKNYNLLLKTDLIVKSGCKQILNFLEQRNIPKAIETSTRTDLAIQKLQKVGIADRFSYIIGGDQVKHGKPAPYLFTSLTQIINRTARLLGLRGFRKWY